MGSALWYLGDSLRYLPGGETGKRAGWIEEELRAVGRLPGITVLSDAYEDYEHTPHFRAEAWPMTAGDFGPAMQLIPSFTEEWPYFRQLREDYDRPDLLLQRGVPAPLDLSLYAFKGEGLAPGLLDPITAAKADAVLAVNTEARGRVMFQLESPAAVAMAADGQAKFAARLLAQLPGQCPGTIWGVHLCFGDWHHKAMTHLGNAAPLADLVTALAAEWPGLVPWQVLHLPMAAADEPPSLDPAWYEPLRGIRETLPAGCQLAAGFAHAGRSLKELRQLQDTIEAIWGAEVMVAAACGLGRYPDPDEALKVLTKMAILAGPR
jgi:hypothetical protein